MKAITTLSLLMALLIVAAAGAQQAGQPKERELTVEELYLQNIEAQILREKAFSDDREIKMLVLDDIDKMIDDNKVSEDDQQIELILEYLAMEGTIRRIRESNALVNYYPEVRRRAAGMLGRVGGESAKNTLVTVLITDDEPMVKAEAVFALGVIGKNENNEVAKAIVYTLNKQDPEKPDNNFAFATCLAMEKLAKANNGIRYPDAYRVLVRIAQGNYIRTVKQKALQTLDELKKYQ